MDMKEAIQMVINCMGLTLSGDTAQIKAGEEKLNQLTEAPGFGAVVVQVFINADAPFPYRQLAGLLLRQYIAKRWDDEEAGDGKPVLSDGEKAAIRGALPQLLGDPNSKIRTAASWCIASIAEFDFPDNWPGLLESLVGAMGSSNPIHVYGALRCLVLMAEEINDESLVKAVPHMFPLLLRVFAEGSNCSVRAQIRCLTVYRILCESMKTISGNTHDDEWETIVGGLLTPTLGQFVTIISNILRHRPSGATSTDDSLVGEGNTTTGYGLRLEALKTLKVLLENFRPLFKAADVSQFLQPLWEAMVASFPLYERDVINTEEEDAPAFDSDGDAVGLSPFMIVCFEFFKELTEGAVTRPLLTPMLPALTDLIIGYCQLSSRDAEAVTEDPNQYAEDEDDLMQQYTVRGAGLDLLNALDDRLGLPAVTAIAKSVQKRLLESAKGGVNAWKQREAAVFALGNLTEEFFDGRIEFDMAGFVTNVLVPDLDIKNPNPHLRSRAVWCVSHLAGVFATSGQQALVNHLLVGTVRALQPDQPLPVRITASRALTMMCSKIDKAIMAPAMPDTLSGLGQLLSVAKGEVLNASLDGIYQALDINIDATKSVWSKLVPLLITSWQQQGSTPLVTEAILDIFQSFLKIPGLLGPISEQLFPAILAPIGQPDEFDSGVVEASLDIFRHILSAYEAAGVAYPDVFLSQGLGLVMKLCLLSEDHSSQASAAMVLTAYVRYAGKQIGSLTIGTPPVSALQLLLACVKRLLDLKQVDLVSCHGPPLVAQVLKLNEFLKPDDAAGIIRLVVQRLHSSQLPTAVEASMMLFARLTHSLGADLLNFLQRVGDCDVINKIPLPLKKATKKNKYPKQEYEDRPGKVNALAFVLQKWCGWQTEFHSPYPAKVTITALCKLLQLKDVRLMQCPTDGYPITEGVGRSTRRNPAELKYNQIPVAAKIVSLLVNRWQELGADEIVKAAAKAKEIENKNGAAAYAPGSAEAKAISAAADAHVRGSKGSKFADADDYSAYLEDEFEGGAESYKKLSDFADDGGSGFDDDDVEEEEKDAYPERETDPLWAIDELTTLKDFFLGWATADMASLTACVMHLSDKDKKLLEKLLNNVTRK